jgi:hypothetical protein
VTNDIDSGVNGVTGGFMVQSVVLSNSQVSHYKNGTLIDSATHTFATGMTKLVLGAEIGGKGEARMEIASALIYNRGLSAGERSQVETYLESKYLGAAPLAPLAANADQFEFVALRSTSDLAAPDAVEYLPLGDLTHLLDTPDDGWFL